MNSDKTSIVWKLPLVSLSTDLATITPAFESATAIPQYYLPDLVLKNKTLYIMLYKKLSGFA